MVTRQQAVRQQRLRQIRRQQRRTQQRVQTVRPITIKKPIAITPTTTDASKQDMAIRQKVRALLKSQKLATIEKVPNTAPTRSSLVGRGFKQISSNVFEKKLIANRLDPNSTTDTTRIIFNGDRVSFDRFINIKGGKSGFKRFSSTYDSLGLLTYRKQQRGKKRSFKFSVNLQTGEIRSSAKGDRGKARKIGNIIKGQITKREIRKVTPKVPSILATQKQFLQKIKNKEVTQLDAIKREIIRKTNTKNIDVTQAKIPNKFGAELISVAPKPKTLLAKINQLQSENTFLINSLSKTTHLERVFRGVAISAALGGAKGVLGVVEAIKNPIAFIKSQFDIIKDPIGTITRTGQAFIVDPVGVAAEFFAFGRASRGVSSVAKNSALGRTVREEVFIRSQPKEIRTPVRAIIESSRVQEAINPTNVKKLKKIDFAEVKELTPLEAKAIRKTLQQTDSVVFGSVAARTISRKGTPQPKDVDLATTDVAKFSRTFLNNIPKGFRNNYIIRREKIIRKSDGAAILDVKPLDRLIPNRSILTRRGFIPVSGYVKRIEIKKGSVLPIVKTRAIQTALEVPTQKIIKVGGIKITGFGEQTVRKGLGTLQVLIEKNTRRAKDPQAFIIQLKIQVDALRKSKPKTITGRSRRTSDIRTLQNAINILQSASFARLLESRVPGITKDFPLVAKIDVKKLRRIKRSVINKKVKELIEKKTREKKRIIPKKKLIKRKRIKKKKVIRKKKPSRLPKKRPSRLPSKIPSRIPKRRISRLPSKLPSKLRPSRLPSKLRPSKIPSKLPSKLRPSKLPSKIPSRIPPSRLPKRVPSRLPPGRDRRRRTITPRETIIIQLKDKRKRDRLKKLTRGVIRKQKFIFIPDLYSRVFGIKASKEEKIAFLRTGRLFTGLEQRKLVGKRR